MFGRKFSDTIRKKKKIIYTVLFTFIMLLGIGYASFESNLSIGGTLDVKGYTQPTLYNVLKKEAITGGLAREYTGAHGDSMDSSKSTEKIYHWYAENDTQGTQILNKNNVIFAGQCWQMIRTTDTGGVKMIYTQKEIYDYLSNNPLGVTVEVGDVGNLNSADYIFLDYLNDEIIGSDNEGAYQTFIQVTVATREFDDRTTLVKYVKDYFKVMSIDYEKSFEFEYFLARMNKGILLKDEPVSV